MQENEQQNWCGHKCHNGMCGCMGHHMGFHILRWVLGIIVILMSFGFGVQIGEFKAAFESGYGYRHHNMMYYSQPSMMGGYQYGREDVSAGVAVPTTVKK